MRRPDYLSLSFLSLVPLVLMTVPDAAIAQAAEGSRRIEEVIVTAERRESSVQDTAISITAFTGEFIEDFGLRNQEDLQNYTPATTIQPYDLSIRGVGRLFRALGGDPGVATYFDGAYSEDFGIASTEGGLFDIERIEILRGPQGTLYGRNGVGGAVNFISKKPSDEFMGEVKGIYGNYNTQELFGVVSGPIIPGLLNARANGVKRTRDGFIDDLIPGNPDINNYGDENYALGLEFTPSERISIWARGNERSYRRRMSGAAGTGQIIVSENGGLPDPVTGGKRWTSVPVQGFRAIDDPTLPGAVFCDDAVTRNTPTCIVPAGTVPYINDANPWYAFTNKGVTRYAQPLVGGVDSAGLGFEGISNSGFATPNYAFQAASDVDIQRLNEVTQGDGTRIPRLKGGDLKTVTNGFQDEFFDHQAGYLNASWDVTPSLSFKYIGAYTDYFYHRTTEDDRTGFFHDQQFYAAQENENFQHELQMFLDVGPDITLTAGLFYYENDIDQQLDFYSTDSWVRYTGPADYGEAGASAYLAGDPTAFLYIGPVQVNHRTAQNLGKAGVLPNLAGLVPLPSFTHPNVSAVYFADGAWLGDTVATTGTVDEGPQSNGTTFIWDTENRTRAKAIYLQGEWQINELFALTLGVRWAEDDKEAEENLYLYQESRTAFATCAANGGSDCAANLFAYNRDVTAGVDETGNVTDFDTVRFSGVPYSRSIYREIENSFDDVTWRVNLDFTPTADDLFYFSVTTGYRAGGFNLGYFSFIPTYDPEEITAYEIGYKGQMFDGTLQINASAYYYDYENIHLQFSTSSFTGTSTSVQNAPSARTIGFEADVIWLPADALTVGGTYSFTDAEYNKELLEPTTGQVGVLDDGNPYAPASVFSQAERSFGIDGEPLPRVPRHKFTGWAEYVLRLGDNGSMTFLTSLAYTDEFPAAGRPLPATPLVTAPDYVRWDARVSWASVRENWNVSAFVNNITNEVGVRNQFVYSELEGHRRVVEPTNPRMYGMEVRYKFGAY